SSQSLYALTDTCSVAENWCIYNLDSILAGGVIKYTSLPLVATITSTGTIGGASVGNAYGILISNGAFYVASQDEVSSHPTGKLFKLSNGGRSYIGDTGYYFPYGMAAKSNGDVYVAFAQSYPSSQFCGTFTRHSIGKLSLSTGSIDSTTITSTSNSYLQIL